MLPLDEVLKLGFGADDAKSFRQGVFNLLPQTVWNEVDDSDGEAGVHKICHRLEEDEYKVVETLAEDKPDPAKILCATLVSRPSAGSRCAALAN